MKRYIEGTNRARDAILPECLDDYVSCDNAVRAIDAFVEALNLSDLGFEGVHPEATGRPSLVSALREALQSDTMARAK